MSPEHPLYPIRTVAELTGVNAVTLRAWERRYGLINPHRTPKGHRLYTQANIELIREVLALLDRGMPIGQVSRYLEQQQRGIGEAAGTARQDDWKSYQQRLIQAIIDFNEQELDAVYNDALALYPIDVVTEHLLTPLLRKLGERWRSHPGGIAEEHFFSVYMRNKIGARLHHQPTRQGGPLLLCACLPGEQHEMGLLLFCLAAANHGYRFINLGADTPYEALGYALDHTPVEAVLLSGSAPAQANPLDRTLHQFISHSPVPVMVGGKIAEMHHDEILGLGATPLGTDTPTALKRMMAIVQQRREESGR